MNAIMHSKPHVMVIPFPAQGHVMPLMKLSCCLVDRGFRVTFVNTDYIHDKLMDALTEEGNEQSGIHMVAIPDGLAPYEHNNGLKLLLDLRENMSEKLEQLIRTIAESSKSDKVTCVIADVTMGWALDVAMKMGIRRASFFPQSAAVKALLSSIPKLIETGVIDDKGTAMKNETILLSSTMPPMEPTRLVWQMGVSYVHRYIFQILHENNQIAQSAEWILCNSSDQLEHAAISFLPKLLPIGPLLASNRLGNFLPEDSTCMDWLDQQATKSVIYIAFGSIANLNPLQFKELAFGLELLSQPFLWVVRANGAAGSTMVFPDGFQDRVAPFGKVVAWAPQLKVLSHPSVACFISHCGWNSTMDGVTTGIPFIAWPSFSDQFSNQTYITDVWKVGLGLNAGEDGIVSTDEICRKVDQLLGDKMIRENALNLKKMVGMSIGQGGSSSKNFEQFVEELKN